MHIIYGLQDPREHKFFYVGMTEDVYKRFVEHIQCSGNNLKKNLKITEMRSAGVLPLMVELERTEDTGIARVREIYWINHYVALGHPITNIAHSVPKLINKVLVRSKKAAPIKRAIQAAEDAPKFASNRRDGIPDTVKNAIVDLYNKGHRRTAIQNTLDLNGDEYWMVKAVCDEYDREREGV